MASGILHRKKQKDEACSLGVLVQKNVVGHQGLLLQMCCSVWQCVYVFVKSVLFCLLVCLLVCLSLFVCLFFLLVVCLFVCLFVCLVVWVVLVCCLLACLLAGLLFFCASVCCTQRSPQISQTCPR